MNSKVPSHNTLEQQFVAPGVEDLQIDKDLEPKQRKEMEDLLNEYHDIFARKPSEVGRTGVIKH